jgi:transposase InsO family protein
MVKSFAIQPKRTSFRSPWQNGVAERWVGNCRRDLLDHVIVVNERHLKRLLNEYLSYYHEDGTHLAWDKQTPTQQDPLYVQTWRPASPLRPGRLNFGLDISDPN